MSIHEETFEVGDTVIVDVNTAAGDVLVSAGEPGTVVIGVDAKATEHFDIAQRGDTVIAHLRRGLWRRGGSTDVRVVAPPGCRLQVVTASGDVSTTMDLGVVEITTASGDIRLRGVSGRLSVKTASGDIEAENLGDTAEVITASGDVRVASIAGSCSFSTASGDVRIDRADDAIDLKSASGDFSLRSFDGRSLTAKSMSGDVKVGIPPRRRLEVDFNSLSGRIDNRLPAPAGSSSPERTISLEVKSVSGDLTLVGA